jgi:diaminopropionate ammonia-lyase
VPLSELSTAPLAFHQTLPGYSSTPLVRLPKIERALGLQRVWVKDETHRLGTSSFKILGASWAIACLIAERQGTPAWDIRTYPEVRELVRATGSMTLVAATDGNHGAAVARVARMFGLDAQIWVPANVSPQRIFAIESEGAKVNRFAGSYDDAVTHVASLADSRTAVISDTSWEGYEATPTRIVEGYTTLFQEADEQVRNVQPGSDSFSVVIVQIGVGSLAAAAGAHFSHADLKPKLFGVEPTDAACMMASIEAGMVVSLPGSQNSVMAGLNCGTPSHIAFPVVKSCYDGFAAVTDELAESAVRTLKQSGIATCETGAAGLAGLEFLIQRNGEIACEIPGFEKLESMSVLLLVTEGVTDPASFDRIVTARD